MTDTEQRTSLADICSELFAFAFQLRASKDPGAGADVKTEVAKLFMHFEDAATSARYKPESVQLAKYALVAYIDEIVLGSHFPMKDDWAGSPLQLEYFNDFAAGEEFYNKLDSIRNGSSDDRSSILQVYFLALTHGFKGKFIDLKGMEERKALIGQLSNDLREGPKDDTTQLSPSWEPPDHLPTLVKNTPTWLIPAMCAVVLFLFLIIFSWTISSFSSSAEEAITSGATE
ncbi:MAG: DotU family type IV/VI secretion system protein [Planctomycetes bacterium]|nr:DotU family type IV/VI secretion system protein [Planctomycetota bacterium]